MKLYTTAFALGLAWVGLAAPPALAQGPAPRHLSELEATGVVFMDDVNTPLLHHAATGAPYDLRILADGDSHTNVYRPERALRAKLDENDEFVRAESMPQWRAIVAERIARLRQAQAYLIPLEVTWHEYDFARARYPVTLAMNKRGFRAGPSYHCAGAFGTGPQRSFRTACLHAVNEDQHDPFLRYFPVEDQQVARALRQSRGEYMMFAVAEPAGKYRVLRGNEVRYMPLQIFAAAGYQPVRITQLILAKPEGEIFAIVRKEPAAGEAGVRQAADKPVPATAAAGAGPGADATAAPSGWNMVARDHDAALYVDPDSVRREGTLVITRTLSDYEQAQASGLRSAVSLYENDCGKRSFRLLRTKEFSARFGKGRTLAEQQEASPPMPIVKGSIGEKLFTFACNAGTAPR